MLVIGGLCLAFFLILLVIGVIVWLRFRRFARELKQAVGSGAAASTPPRIHLMPRGAAQWTSPLKIDAHRASLSAAEFTEVGVYTINEMPGIQLLGFVRASDSLCAVVYEHAQVGVWCDLYRHNEDGTSLTVTSAPRGHEFDERPGHRKIYMKGSTVGQLLEEFARQQGASPAIAMTAENFAQRFEQAYADQMDWRNARGGPIAEEIRRVAGEMEGHYDEASIKQTQEVLARKASEGLTVACLEGFLKARLAEGEDLSSEANHLVIVHERLTPADILALFRGWGIPPALAEIELAGMDPLAAFTMLNGHPKHELRFILLGATTAPARADVYRAPRQ